MDQPLPPIRGTRPSDIGCKAALPNPNQLSNPVLGQIAGCDLAPDRLLRDAEPRGDLGDAQKPLSRFE